MRFSHLWKTHNAGCFTAILGHRHLGWRFVVPKHDQSIGSSIYLERKNYKQLLVQFLFVYENNKRIALGKGLRVVSLPGCSGNGLDPSRQSRGDQVVRESRDRHRYIPEGLFRTSYWLSPTPHRKAPSTPACGVWGCEEV
ncbi:hypothetical protein OUZ56_021669 [Daphnia magna]|uniref:Uncharacterized protein n=1 Tax=Daphnia magna TaxID=35525 RepID=A0ABR0AU92_9CRUS|nr:hypothetical protein OUZ56_021669 [Daphnia magna]